MMDASRDLSQDMINAIFTHLDQRDVEQFYTSYQLWVLQQHIVDIQARIQSVTQQIATNQERLQRVHPSAIALATLARLQSNGVNDIDLLDRMLARGEDWLDRTMQRLAYCEKFDFIRDNYSDWCEHALEGAYDWIDSVDEAQIEIGTTPSPTETSEVNTLSDASVDAQAQTTEEMLLLKLMSEEDEALMQAPTLKIAALTPVKPQKGTEEVISPESDETEISPAEPVEFVEPAQAENIPADEVPAAEDDEAAEDDNIPLEQAIRQTGSGPIIEEVIQPETNDTNTTNDASVAAAPSSEQVLSTERIEVDESTPMPGDEETDASSSTATSNAPTEKGFAPETSRQSSSRSTSPRQKRSFLRRLISAFFGK